MSLHKNLIFTICLLVSGILTANAETLTFTGPSIGNTIHYTVKNSLFPRMTRTITVTANADPPVHIQSPVSQKVKLLADQSRTFTFLFDIDCLSIDRSHIITFTPLVNSGKVQTDPSKLNIFLMTRLNKCQQCENNSIIPRLCPEPAPCFKASENCHPFLGCLNTTITSRKCNETVLNTYAIHYSNDGISADNHSTKVDSDPMVSIHHYPFIRSIHTHPADNPHIWIDDSLPDGAVQMDSWEWSFKQIYSGNRSHINTLTTGRDLHYFIRSEQTLKLNTGDNYIQYVWLDPEHCPNEILIQFYVDNGDGEHRVYWGENAIPTGGINGTQSLFHMGALPVPGQWTRLKIPAHIVGLTNKPIKGVAFGVYQGIVYWDRSTKSSQQTETQTEYQTKAPLPIPYDTSITHISYSITQAELLACVIMEMNDPQAIIQEFDQQIVAAGWYDLTWNGLDTDGSPVSDGNYMIQCTKADQSLLFQRSFEKRSIISHIHRPPDTAMISGSIPITGKAAAEHFSKYTLSYASAFHPLEWTPFFDSDHPVYPQQADAGLLGVWAIPETLTLGEYLIRLRVYKADGLYMDDYVSVYLSASVSRQGSTVVSCDGKASLEIPQNAISENTLLFSLSQAVAPPDVNPNQWTRISSIYQLLPAEYHFLTPCTLNIHYTDLQVMGINLADLYIFYYHSTSEIWIPLPTHRDELNHVLTTTLTDLSESLKVYFAILYSPKTIATVPPKGSINSDPALLTDNLIPSPILNTWENDIMNIQHNQSLSQLTIHGGHTPSVLYNSQQIVFMSERSGNEDIWIIDVTDYKESQNTAKPLTLNPAHDRLPSCSPIDDSIAFVSDRDGTYRIYVIKSDGSGLMPLTQEVDPNAHPSWSPDASQLVYIKYNNLYVIQTDGFNETMLTSDGFEKKSHPVWSHDGTRIAYTCYGLQPQLASIQVNGLTKTFWAASGIHPEWSQDDSFLLYSSLNPFQGIYGISFWNQLSYSYIQYISDTQDVNPVFFPKSHSIAFESTREGISNIWLMTPVSIDSFTADPIRFSPNSDGIMDTTKLSFKLSGGHPDVGILIYQSRDFINKEIAVNTVDYQKIEWDGTGHDATTLPDGQYTCTIIMSKNLTETIEQSITITIDTTPPEFDQWMIPIELSDEDQYISMTVISGIALQSAWLQYGVASAMGLDQPNIVHWNDFGNGLDGTLHLNWSAFDGMVLMIRAFAQDVLGNYTYSTIYRHLITQSQNAPNVRSSRIAVQAIKNDYQQHCANQLKNAIARLQLLAGMRLEKPASCVYIFNVQKICLENVLTILQSISKDNLNQ